MKVVKRDGREVEFDKQKIVDAILKSFDALGEKDTQYAINKAKEIANYVEGFIEGCDRECLGVETIQDLVEEKLMKSNRKDVAKHYILYRDQRTRERERKSQLIQDIGEKITASNVQNQNANVDEHSFGGRMGEANSVVMKKYALDYCMSDMARNNHLNNEIYEHDLDHFVVGDHNCLTVPFDKLLATGFNTRQTDVRPAQSINTAFQLVAVIFQLQSLQQFGGVSASHIDWTMVPYVRKSFYKHYADGAMFIENKDGRWLQEYIYDYINDPECFVDEQSIESKHWKSEPKIYKYALEMTKKETYQAVEGMYHNLNTLQSRSGNQLPNQLPFTSINYGTCTLPEGRMVTKAILDVSIDGIGALHKTSIFPCGIFQYMKGVNDKPGTPNYDLKKLAIKSTAKRLYPNYVNVDWSVNKGYDRNDPTTYVSTMGCRTYNGFDINGLGQIKDGRGNICPVTIIMPTLAMEAKTEIESCVDVAHDEGTIINGFMSLLDKKIHEAKDMLIERFNWICSQSPDSAKFMYENGLMEGYIPEEGIRSALKHGTIVIGQIGLAETLQILIGCDHTTEKGMELAKKIEQLFKDRCAEFKQEYKLNFGVYYTPAENLCYTAMKKFKDKYGVIPNVSDKKFFTNSIHVPVWKKMNPFEIDIESQLTGYSNAGCITYVELESSVKSNLDAVESIIDYAMDKDIPYFAINIPNDMCMDCGYTDDINEKCPQCGGENIQRLRRVTGYLTGNYTTAFNEGKQQETEMRYKHSLNLPNWKR